MTHLVSVRVEAIPTMRKRLFIWLGVLQAFVGVGAVVGGLGLALDPSGESLGIPLDLLADTPFANFLIPGVLLFTVNGVGSLTGAIASFARHRYSGHAAMALGTILIAWIVVQVYWFAGTHWLHWLYLALGIVELALGSLVRRDVSWQGARD